VAQTTVPEPLAHHELGSILGYYSLYGLTEYRNPAVDPLPVVLLQLRACEEQLTGAAEVERVPLCNVAWENLYVVMGTVLYLAVSVGTHPRLRDILHGLLEAWRTSAFCRERAHFMLETGTLEGALLRGADSQRIVVHSGTRSLTKLITWTSAKPGEVAPMSVRVLSSAQSGQLAPLKDFAAATRVPGNEAQHQSPEHISELLDRFRRDGPPRYTREIGAELSRITGLSQDAAALVWAGNTDATDAVNVVATPETRQALGLTVKTVKAASHALYPLHDYMAGESPRIGFYRAYQTAMPAKAEDLWRPLEGGEDSVVARLGRSVAQRLREMPTARRRARL
jgi:hypothetical protein